MASHGIAIGLAWSRLGLAMRPFGLTWPLPWPLLVSNAHHYRTRALFCWVHVASHGLSFGLSWPRLGLPEASPEQPRSVPGASLEHPRRTGCSFCTTKNSCSGSQTAVIGGSSEQQAGLRPGPGSAPDQAPPRTGLKSGCSSEQQAGLRPGPGSAPDRETALGWAGLLGYRGTGLAAMTS